MRTKRDFGFKPITEYASDFGVSEVIGSSFGGLYFVVRKGIRFAVIADDPNDASAQTWLPDFWEMHGVKPDGSCLNV